MGGPYPGVHMLSSVHTATIQSPSLLSAAGPAI